jgi:uncharacterized membrane protein
MMIPKSRLDALTDGVFAVAMTLLVLDLRLPESFAPHDAAELEAVLRGLLPQAVVYSVSFYVLALCWVRMLRLKPRGNQVSEDFAKWVLVYLLLITFVPFTTITVGRFLTFAPAVWLYAANTTLFALVALRMTWLVHPDDRGDLRDDRIGLGLLIAASVLAVVVSLILPRGAMLAYLLNLADKPLRSLLLERRGTG